MRFNEDRGRIFDDIVSDLKPREGLRLKLRPFRWYVLLRALHRILRGLSLNMSSATHRRLNAEPRCKCKPRTCGAIIRRGAKPAQYDWSGLLGTRAQSLVDLEIGRPSGWEGRRLQCVSWERWMAESESALPPLHTEVLERC